MKLSNIQRATLFATQKEIERLLETTENIPFDTRFDVGGRSLTITLPDGLSIERGVGDGDGTIRKKATTNLYGYAILYEIMRYARLFKQHKLAHRILMSILRRAIKRGESTADAYQRKFPDHVQAVEQFRKEWSNKMPKRKPEATPRRFSRDGNEALPEITFNQPAKAA